MRPRLDFGCCFPENGSEPLVTRSNGERRRTNSKSEKQIYMCFSESVSWPIAKLINANLGSQILETGQCFIVKKHSYSLQFIQKTQLSPKIYFKT
jgi:hypothetical protein